jgi:hypothetical protein
MTHVAELGLDLLGLQSFESNELYRFALLEGEMYVQRFL